MPLHWTLYRLIIMFCFLKMRIYEKNLHARAKIRHYNFWATCLQPEDMGWGENDRLGKGIFFTEVYKATRSRFNCELIHSNKTTTKRVLRQTNQPEISCEPPLLHVRMCTLNKRKQCYIMMGIPEKSLKRYVFIHVYKKR